MSERINHYDDPGKTLTAIIFKDGEYVQTISFPEVDDGYYSVILPDQTSGSYFVQIVFDGNVIGTGSATIPPTQFKAIAGSVGASPTAFFFTSPTLANVNDLYNNMVLTFIECSNPDLEGITREITDYTGSTKRLEFDVPWDIIPSEGDFFSILGRIE